jgi:hypothetical protein
MRLPRENYLNMNTERTHQDITGQRKTRDQQAMDNSTAGGQHRPVSRFRQTDKACHLLQWSLNSRDARVTTSVQQTWRASTETAETLVTVAGTRFAPLSTTGQFAGVLMGLKGIQGLLAHQVCRKKNKEANFAKLLIIL